MKKYKIFILICLASFFSINCSSNNEIKYEKTPLDKIVTKYINEPNYSVILADMNYEEANDLYQHKYQVIIEKPQLKVDSLTLNDTLTKAKDIDIVTTDWKKVNPIFFEKHLEDLGMTILTKKEGVLDRVVSPAGMDNYVGNKRYGHWERQSNGSSFWAFYGQYYFMSRMFYGPSYYSYNNWNDYNRNYRGRQAYYGSGNTRYGTRSKDSNKIGKTSWAKKPQTFKSKVQTNVKKSSTKMKSRGYSSSSSYSKKSRSSSRYSSSSSRSRGGGSGK